MTHESPPFSRPLEDPVVKMFGPLTIARDKPYVAIVPAPWDLKIYDVGNDPWPGKSTVEFKLELGYDNGFGDKISESQCQVWTPVITIQRSTTMGGLLFCDGLGLSIKHIQQRIQEAEKRKQE
jgi:hypothetical protein